MDKKELEEKRRGQILSAAMSLFSMHGYYRTDVEKIAAAVGIGKGTIYRYFENKEALFLATVEWGFGQLKETVLGAVSKESKLLEKIKTAIISYLGFFEEHKGFYRVLIEEKTTFRDELESIFKDKYLPHIRLLEDALTLGVEEGLIKPIHPAISAWALIGMTNAIIYRWFMDKKEYPLTREAEAILEIYLHGIKRREE